MAGYIKIHRKLREWGWYGVPSVKDTFIHLLITAAYAPYEYKGVLIARGAAIFSYDKLSDELGFSIQQIRTAIQKLKKTGEICVWTNRQFSVATIVNYDEYQDEQQTNNKRITNEQQTINGRLTDVQQTDNTIKEDKEDKESKKIKEKYGVLANVLLTKEEHSKLKEQFSDYQDRIDRLSEYIASTGKRYKSHYATILSWARKDDGKPPDKNKNRGSMYSVESASFDIEKYEKKGLFDD